MLVSEYTLLLLFSPPSISNQQHPKILKQIVYNTYKAGSVRAALPHDNDYTLGTSVDIWLTITLTKAALTHAIPPGITSIHTYLFVFLLSGGWRLHFLGFITY